MTCLSLTRYVHVYVHICMLNKHECMRHCIIVKINSSIKNVLLLFLIVGTTCKNYCGRCHGKCGYPKLVSNPILCFCW